MNKRETVIETARNLFTKYGYKKVSMDEVAKESNVTKKTIYSYFKDKEDLFKFFIQEELNIMKKDIEAKEKANSSFLDIVSSSIYYTLTYRKNSPFFTNILKEKSSLQTECFIKIYDDEIIKYIEEKIAKEINAKNIKKCDAHLTAFIIYKVYIAVMFEYENDLDEEKVTKEITSILREGLLN